MFCGNLSTSEESICREIVDCAFKVHSQLGPGLLEKIYECCFCHELQKKNLNFQRQVETPIYYDGLYFPEGLRLDVIVEDLIVVELKSVDSLAGIYFAQLKSYLKLIERNLGFLINFNVPLIKDGIRRISI